jgi:hypothetical protein
MTITTGTVRHVMSTIATTQHVKKKVATTVVAQPVAVVVFMTTTASLTLYSRARISMACI